MILLESRACRLFTTAVVSSWLCNFQQDWSSFGNRLMHGLYHPATKAELMKRQVQGHLTGCQSSGFGVKHLAEASINRLEFDCMVPEHVLHDFP